MELTNSQKLIINTKNITKLTNENYQNNKKTLHIVVRPIDEYYI